MSVISQSMATRRSPEPAAFVRWSNPAGLPSIITGIAVVGIGVPHFHQHVFARHRGTPRELNWMASNEWADAPHGDAAALANLADRLREHFQLSSGR